MGAAVEPFPPTSTGPWRRGSHWNQASWLPVDAPTMCPGGPGPRVDPRRRWPPGQRCHSRGRDQGTARDACVLPGCMGPAVASGKAPHSRDAGTMRGMGRVSSSTWDATPATLSSSTRSTMIQTHAWSQAGPRCEKSARRVNQRLMQPACLRDRGCAEGLGIRGRVTIGMAGWG